MTTPPTPASHASAAAGVQSDGRQPGGQGQGRAGGRLGGDDLGGEPVGGRASAPGLPARLAAETFGSLFLVVAGLGVPLFTIPQSSPLPAALAAGLALTAAMLAVGHVSGGHFNPVITAGSLLAGRIRAGAAARYIVAQLVGAAIGALALFAILRTLPGIPDSRTAFDTVAPGFGEHSIIQAPLAAVLLLEVLGAAILMAVFLATTGPGQDSRTAAPVAVGLSFAVLLQLGQSVGNLPFNPARATASAVFSSGWALEQLWLFWVAPLVGAAIAGLLHRVLSPAAPARAEVVGTAAAPAEAVPAGARTPDALHEVDDANDADDVDGVDDAEENEARSFFEGKRG